MNPEKVETTINFKYVLATLIAVVLSWMLHELAHWSTGELLGNDMIMTLNTCYPKSGSYVAKWQETMISASGPILTLLQAIIFYFLLKRNSGKILFPFLLTCLYMRLLAGAMNFINLNDEGRISKDLGLGTFTLPILMVAILFYLTYDISKTRGFKAKFITVTTLLILLFSSILILADQAFKIQILK